MIFITELKAPYHQYVFIVGKPSFFYGNTAKTKLHSIFESKIHQLSFKFIESKSSTKCLSNEIINVLY